MLSDLKDVQTVGPVSCIFYVNGLVGDVKEPTSLFEKRILPVIVVWPVRVGASCVL